MAKATLKKRLIKNCIKDFFAQKPGLQTTKISIFCSFCTKSTSIFMHFTPFWIKNTQILLFVKEKLHPLGQFFSHLIAKCTKESLKGYKTPLLKENVTGL